MMMYVFKKRFANYIIIFHNLNLYKYGIKKKEAEIKPSLPLTILILLRIIFRVSNVQLLNDHVPLPYVPAALAYQPF